MVGHIDFVFKFFSKIEKKFTKTLTNISNLGILIAEVEEWPGK